MELRVFGTTLLRRWYLVLAAVLLAGGATAYVMQQSGPTYRASGSVLLFPPATTIEEESETVTEGNPYLFLDGLGPARDILIRTMTSAGARGELAAAHPTTGYDMTADPSTSGPIILLDVTAASADEALSALDALLAEIPPALTELQTGLEIVPDARITSRVLTHDSSAAEDRMPQLRKAIIAGAGALALLLLLIGLVDGLRASRRDRVGAAEAEPESDHADVLDPPEGGDRPPVDDRDDDSDGEPVVLAEEHPDLASAGR